MSIVNLFSPNWHPADSYGRIAHELTAGLEANGYHVNKFGDDAPAHLVKPCLGGIFLGYPTMHERFIRQFPLSGVGVRLAITMFESTKLPDDWREPLNECGAVLVPAQFLVNVFKQAGIEAPIEVVPLGISKPFTGHVRQVPLPNAGTETPMTFVCIGDRGNRKNWQKVIFAFVRAFGDDERFKLVIKSRNLPLRLTNKTIEIVAEDYSDEQMAILYKKSHVMVFPSSGEGFGLPPREFAATGGISLVTNWGGTADDIQQWGIPLPYTMADAWSDKEEWHGKLGQWADIDIDMLADQMRHVADYYQHYTDFGIRAAGFVRSHYRWQTFANHVKLTWERLVKESVVNAHNRHRENTVAPQNERLLNLIPG
jgi:glycosyltransferase involved in cell wall biosynthesis